MRAAQTLNHNEKVLLALIASLNEPWSYRTKLVKLAYMLDNLSYETTGSQMTSFAYAWDHFGPNAVGNAIVDTLGELSTYGFVACREFPNQYDGTSCVYGLPRVEDPVSVADLQLSADELALIERAVREWGHMTVPEITTASKDTEPVRQGTQYDRLEFRSNPRIERRKMELKERAGDFIEEGFEAAASDEPATSIEKLRRRVG